MSDGQLPLNIYLVRHGESQGNVNRDLYKEVADHAIVLTDKGIKQARDTGAFLAETIKSDMVDAADRVRVWHSSYYRGRQTAFEVVREMGKVLGTNSQLLSYREEPFIIEQKAGLFDGAKGADFARISPDAAADYEKHRKFNGTFYAGVPLGESKLETVLRAKHFLGTVHRDYIKHNIRHVVVVAHGRTIPAYLMALKRYPPEWFDAEKNPGNGWVRHVSGDGAKGYADHGYIHGEAAPLRNPMATQTQLENADKIYMLKPQRPNTLVPMGVKLSDPFEGLNIK